MNVREATAADEPTLLEFTRAIFDENWDRPWRPPEVTPAMFEGKLVLLAEEEDETGRLRVRRARPRRATRT